MTQSQFKLITEWQNKTFPNANVDSKLFHLMDEIKEVLESKDDFNLQEEFADCFILLFGAASCAGFNYNEIIEAIDRKMKINITRKWGKPNENGVVNHIKE